MMSAEKRADAVIKWLERLKKSYRSGAVESAFLDAECARAEIEDLRASIFSGFSDRKNMGKNHKCSKFFLLITRVFILSTALIMVMVSPLSREIKISIPASNPDFFTEKKVEKIEMIQKAEKISEKISEKIEKAEKTGKTEKTKSKNIRVSRKISRTPSSRKLSSHQPQTKPERTKTVAYDRLNELIATGKKALKSDKIWK